MYAMNHSFSELCASLDRHGIGGPLIRVLTAPSEVWSLFSRESLLIESFATHLKLCWLSHYTIIDNASSKIGRVLDTGWHA